MEHTDSGFEKQVTILLQALSHQAFDYGAFAPAHLDPQFIWQSDAFADQAQGEAVQDFIKSLRSAFPGDFNVELVGLMSNNDDEGVFEFLFSGTHRGFLENVGITNKPVMLRGTAVVRFTDGKVSFARTFWNCTAFMAQLGVRAHMRPDPVAAPYSLR